MRTSKRLLSLLLTAAMIISLIPAAVLAAPAETPAPAETVSAYISVSHDAAFMEDQNLEAAVLRKFDVPYFDLGLYGLQDLYYQNEHYASGDLKPENADSAVYTGKVTVLHLMIYATEILRYGLTPEQAGKGYLLNENKLAESLNITQRTPGSMFITTFWGHDLNLNYYVNHAYPLASAGFGSTMDQILLREGDVLTVGHFSDWEFFNDPRAPFNHIKVNGTDDVLTLKPEDAVSLQVVHDGGGVSGQETTYNHIDYPLDVYAADAAAAPRGDVTQWIPIGTTNETGALTTTVQEIIDAVGDSSEYILAVPGAEATPQDEFTPSTGAIVCAPGAFRLTVEEPAAPVETIQATVTMNTQSVADDVTMLGMTALPASTVVTVPKGSTVKDVMVAWAAQTTNDVVLNETNFITQIGAFGGKGTTAFDTMMANAGIDPVPGIFDYAGWLYTVDGEMPNVGVAEQILNQDSTVAFRLGVYTASGTWEQIDFLFLDAYNGLKARIAEAGALEAPSAAVTEAKTAAEAVIAAIDNEAGGMWLNYFAAKQTAMYGPGSPIDQLQQANKALADALAGKVTPKTITIDANKPELSIGTDYQIPYTVGPEGASQEATFDVLLGGECFTVSETGVITPTKASTLCMVQVKSKEAPSVSANLMFTIADPNQAEADKVIAQINALPAEITLNEFDTVKAVREAYDALTPEQQALVNNLGKLENAIAALADLKQPAVVESYWPNFRGSDSNMAITHTKTPVSAETTELKWNVKLGSGWAAAPSPMILVDGDMVVMVGSTIYRLDLKTGAVKAQGSMVAAIGFGIVVPTYGSGMIFVPLSNGQVQAFDAKTLESLWLYQDPLKGQPNCPITYADGMVYTGFWNSETRDANYVGISVRDEDPTSTHEAKEAVWTKPAKGGYYWAGSVVVGDAVIFGTDDGTSGSTSASAHLYALNRKTGEVISDLSGLIGDQRSSIAYSAEKGRVYFTTKGGYLYSAAVDAVSGALSDLKSMKLDSNQSTSTPVVFGDQVYLCCGAGVGGDTANNFTVCDADTLEQLYVVGLKAYPQCSPLVSDAYLKTEGKLYIYMTYNGQPGGITLIKVDPTKITVDGAEKIELYDAKGFEQYCICSPICGPDGTLYYKNDSCNILAVGSKAPDPADLEAAQSVDNQIEGIGEVTLNIGWRIAGARRSYENLTPLQKNLVTKLDILEAKEAEFDVLKAEDADAKIAKIGTPVTLASESAIKTARTNYDRLTENQKKLVIKLDVLEAAEAELAVLKAAEMDTQIEALPAADAITMDDEAAVLAARAAYDKLTDAQKEKVTKLPKLEAAEEKIGILKSSPVVQAIEALPEASAVTVEDFEAIKAAKNAYDALNDSQKKKVPNAEKLLAVVDKLADLKQPAAVESYWPNFRGGDDNNRIVSARTPVSAETTELKWNLKLGTGWAAAPSHMILVDNAVVVMAGQKIYKLNPANGAILAEGDLATGIGFGIVTPTYGGGMIFCPLSNGQVQAFDAKTLESLWLYKDPLKGQANSPIAYADGMIYTGFWNSETRDANFAAINVRDDDPTTPLEIKTAAWVQPAKGGYYWAGGVVVGNAVIFGTDDGTSGSTGDGAHLYALDRKTGAVISDLTGLVGDQRSTITYSAEKGRVYFTTKGGYLYSAAVDAVSGALSDLKAMKLSSDQSTSTPVVYGNQVYLCCGAGVGGGDVANNFTVCDADTLEQLYVVGMKAYPQCSPLVSDAYMETEGKLYIYLTYNGHPGGITLIKVDPTVSTVDGAEKIELYDAKGFEQYCICSPICGPDGTLYYKNDSCNILAVGSKTLTPTIADAGRTLSLDDIITINNYAVITGFDGVDPMTNGGMLIWNQAPEAADVNTADLVKEGLLKGKEANLYGQSTDGIAAKEYGDELWMCIYMKDAEGTYHYGPVQQYSVRAYCDSAFKTDNVQLKSACVQLLHFGAAAQQNFGYRTDALCNTGIEAGMTWDEALLTPVAQVPDLGITANDDVKLVGRSLSLDGKIMGNFYFEPVGFEATSAELMFWSSADAQPVVSDMIETTRGYGCQACGFNANEYEKTVFVCAKFTAADGSEHYSAVVPFSVEEYARLALAAQSTDALQKTVRQMVLYGEAASIYLAK